MNAQEQLQLLMDEREIIRLVNRSGDVLGRDDLVLASAGTPAQCTSACSTISGIPKRPELAFCFVRVLRSWRRTAQFEVPAIAQAGVGGCCGRCRQIRGVRRRVAT